MKTREECIAFEMNYCQHYTRGKGADMICSAGMDIEAIKRVPTGKKKIKWGPCIEGHLLDDPTSHCPKWIRRTREMGEKRADAIERSIRMMTELAPFLSEWRKKLPIGKQEIVDCPVCKTGKLHLSQSSYNGHVHGTCETKDCVSWME